MKNITTRACIFERNFDGSLKLELFAVAGHQFPWKGQQASVHLVRGCNNVQLGHMESWNQANNNDPCVPLDELFILKTFTCRILVERVSKINHEISALIPNLIQLNSCSWGHSIRGRVSVNIAQSVAMLKGKWCICTSAYKTNYTYSVMIQTTHGRKDPAGHISCHYIILYRCNYIYSKFMVSTVLTQCPPDKSLSSPTQTQTQ